MKEVLTATTPPVDSVDQLRQLARQVMRAFPELAEVLAEVTGLAQ